MEFVSIHLLTLTSGKIKLKLCTKKPEIQNSPLATHPHACCRLKWHARDTQEKEDFSFHESCLGHSSGSHGPVHRQAYIMLGLRHLTDMQWRHWVGVEGARLPGIPWVTLTHVHSSNMIS